MDIPRKVPDGPGLGIELNADVVKSILYPGKRYWEQAVTDGTQ